MAVLIRGMEMPKYCYYCQFLWFHNPESENSEGMCDLTETWNKDIYVRPDWCPLVEVPTPHGRLIDADALRKCIPNEEIASRMAISNAPTIIEAEE